MKPRLNLSVTPDTALYLTRRAQHETGGNVSALVDRMCRSALLTELLQSEAAYHAAHPDAAEEAERERDMAQHLADTDARGHG